MSFVEAIKYNLSHYADFNGRGRRSEFWWFYLFAQILSMVFIGIPYVFVFVAMFAQPGLYDPYNSTGIEFTAGMGVALFFLGIGVLINFALLVPFYASQARRLHDTGQTAHWLWLNLAGLGIVPTIMCIMDGQPHANQYGPDPKSRDAWMAGGYAQPAYGQPVYGQPAYGQQPDAGYGAAPTPPQYAAPLNPGPMVAPVDPAAPPAPPAPPAYGAAPQNPPAQPGNPDDPFASPQQ